MDYEVSDFQSDVIDASHEAPVLVDFWAPWCGPCRQLSPVLETLAEEQDDWTLVKVNTDNHPDPARKYGVRGIPAVKLFVDGTVAAEFNGALPEQAVREWLDENLPSASKERVEQARKALRAGDAEQAEHLLWPLLDEDEDHTEAKVLLAQALAFRDPEQAQALADDADIADPSLRQVRESVQAIARLLQLHEDPDQLPDGEGKERYQAALTALAEQDFETALERFIEVVRSHRDYDEDGARKACVALFTLLGDDHPAVQSYRRTFDMALY
jgi:putative thioredoxin